MLLGGELREVKIGDLSFSSVNHPGAPPADLTPANLTLNLNDTLGFSAVNVVSQSAQTSQFQHVAVTFEDSKTLWNQFVTFPVTVLFWQSGKPAAYSDRTLLEA